MIRLRRASFGPLMALAAWAASAAVAGSASAGEPLRTRNVVILGVDGVRNTEAFKNPFASPAGEAPFYHPFIPRIWSTLVPAGTVFLNTKNTETTYTTPGFNTILSGNWQMGPNRSRQELNAYFESRSRTPLVGEVYRKFTGRDALTIAGKRNSLTNDYSVHPGYGPAFRPRFFFLDAGRLEDLTYDGRTYDVALDEMSHTHPSLVFINFGATDLAGHQRDFSFYASIIDNWDRLVVDFWNFLQSDPFYRDTTTLILTTDHGRHTEQVLDFSSHGGECEGCRDIMLLVIGPDTPANVRVNRRVRLTDVAPTVAEFMGIPLPQVDGEPLAEAMGRTYSPADLGSREIATASNGPLVFIASADRFGSTTGITVKGSRDGGQTFGVPITLTDFTPPVYDDAAKHPRIEVIGDRLHAMWIDLRNPNGRSTLRHRSADLATFAAGGDLEFGPSTALETSILEGQRGGNEELNNGVIINRPSLAALHPGGVYRAAAAFAMNRTFLGFRLSTSDFVNDPKQVPKRSMLPFQRYYPEEPSIAGGAPDEVFVAWIDVSAGFPADVSGDGIPDDVHPWNLMFNRSVDGGVTWSDPPAVLTSGLGSSITPQVAYNPVTGRIHVVFASPNSSGRYQVATVVGRVERRWSPSDCGVDFTEKITLTTSAAGAWEPSIGIDAAGGLHVAYVDYDYPGGDILLGYSPNGKAMGGAPLNLSGTAGISANPSLEVFRGVDGITRRFIAWREEDPATESLRPRTSRLPFILPTR